MGKRDNKEKRGDGDRPETMSEASSPARRVRQASICIGAFVSPSFFVLLGARDLIDQWVAGYASAIFMLGTMLMYMGGCLAIFGIIAGLGYVASAVLPDDLSYQRWLTPGSGSRADANARAERQLSRPAPFSYQ
jgi:hypothetical protein